MRRVIFLAAMTLAGACSQKRSVLLRPADIPIAELSTPTPARLWVGSSRRDITVPWSRTLFLSVRDRSAAPGCPGGGDTPEAAFSNALTEDAAGDRVAFRCGAQAPWGIAYVSPTALWVSCASPVPSASLDWGRVPDLVAAAPALSRCPGVAFTALTEEVRRRGGAPGVGALVSATLTDAADTEAWMGAFRALSPDQQQAIRARATTELGAARPSFSTSFDRLARVADLDTASLDVERLRVLARFCHPGPGLIGCGELFRKLARLSPEAAADFACDQVNSRTLSPLEAAAIARGAQPCEPFRTLHERIGCAAFCEAGASCGDAATAHPCARDEYLAMIDAELAPGGVRGEFLGGYERYSARMLAAAAMQQRVACAPFVDAGR